MCALPAHDGAPWGCRGPCCPNAVHAVPCVQASKEKGPRKDVSAVALRMPYLRVVGLMEDAEGAHGTPDFTCAPPPAALGAESATCTPAHPRPLRCDGAWVSSA